MYRLDVRGLSFEVGSGTRILDDVSLCLRSGELVALLGPSGSGKSTLLTSMIGFRPGRGRVSLCGQDLYERFESLKTMIGFVPQDDILHASLSVRKTLQYAAMLRLPADMPQPLKESEVDTVMEQMELTERADVKVKSLSGGQRKRVSTAVELLARPPLLFLDEPTSGLDPALEEKTMSLFRRLTTPERLTVVTTHVLASLDLVDLLIFVSKGKLVFVGPPKEAVSFFGVEDFPSIYKTLSADPPEKWRAHFRTSSLYSTWITNRLAEPPPALPDASPRSQVTGSARSDDDRAGADDGAQPSDPASTADRASGADTPDAPAPAAPAPAAPAPAAPAPDAPAPARASPSPEEELARLKALRKKG